MTFGFLLNSDQLEERSRWHSWGLMSGSLLNFTGFVGSAVRVINTDSAVRVINTDSAVRVINTDCAVRVIQSLQLE